MKYAKHGRGYVLQNLREAIDATVAKMRKTPSPALADALIRLQAEYSALEELPSKDDVRDFRANVTRLDGEIASIRKRLANQDRPRGLANMRAVL
jgi:hypothetical protein